MIDDLVVYNTSIKAGSSTMIKIPVGRLPSGNLMTINTHIYRSNHDGSVLLLIGGLHGDEINGVEIVRRCIEMNYFDSLVSGSVIAIPVLNVHGFINFSRGTNLSKDVNRSFPGSLTGSLSSRVARTLTKYILPLVNVGIDFHTGGEARFNYPQVRFSSKHIKSAELAEVFNAPFSMIKSAIPKSLRKVAMDLDIPILVYEGGESLRLDEYAISEGMRGVRRIMNHFGLRHDLIPEQNSVYIPKNRWVRAKYSGIFKPFSHLGSLVKKGDVLGYIYEPYGNYQYEVISLGTGYILCVNNNPLVYPGDPLFNIGSTQ